MERQVVAARMAQAEEFDLDMLPDPDKAAGLFYEFLNGEIETADDLSPDDEQRTALGLPRKKR